MKNALRKGLKQCLLLSIVGGLASIIMLSCGGGSTDTKDSDGAILILPAVSEIPAGGTIRLIAYNDNHTGGPRQRANVTWNVPDTNGVAGFKNEGGLVTVPNTTTGLHPDGTDVRVFAIRVNRPDDIGHKDVKVFPPLEAKVVSIEIGGLSRYPAGGYRAFYGKDRQLEAIVHWDYPDHADLITGKFASEKDAVIWFIEGEEDLPPGSTLRPTYINDEGVLIVGSPDDPTAPETRSSIKLYARSKLTNEKSDVIEVALLTGVVDKVDISVDDNLWPDGVNTYSVDKGPGERIKITATITAEGNFTADAIFEVRSSRNVLGGRPIDELTQVRSLDRTDGSDTTVGMFSSVRTEFNTEIEVVARSRDNPLEASDPVFITILNNNRGDSIDWRIIRMGRDHVIAIAADDDSPGAGRLYTWGANQGGQLGYTTDALSENSTESYRRQHQSTPREVVDATAALGTGDRWYQVSGGWAHTMALTENGRLFVWGAIYKFLDGGNPGFNQHQPADIDKLRNFDGIEEIPQQDGSPWTTISAGHSTAFAINEKGDLYGWGVGGNGRVGNGSSSPIVLNPVKIEHSVIDASYYDEIPWVRVTAGQNTAYGIKLDGTLWAWGSNAAGQFGFTDGPDYYETPVEIRPGDLKGAAWRQVVVGSTHVVGLDTRGNMWTWGERSQGRGGIRTTATPAHGWTFTGEEFGTAFSLLSAHGGEASMAISNNGRLFIFGTNGFGQLGHGVNLPAQGAPIDPTTHPYAVSFYDSGSGKWDFMGTTRTDYGLGLQWMPHPLNIHGGELGGSTDDQLWASIVTGGSTTLGIQRDGTLWAWGHNEYGQAGVGTNDSYQLLPVKVERQR